jgi:FixJ family two-component response regulator
VERFGRDQPIHDSWSKPSGTPSCEGIEAGKIDQLSRREFQVAEHAARGETNKQIANQLRLSEHTVKNYLFNLSETRCAEPNGTSFPFVQVLCSGCESRGTRKRQEPALWDLLKAAEEA